MHFSYTAKKVSECATIVAVEGDIDAGTGIQLEEALDKALSDANQTRIIFDLANTNFVSSSGLRLFMVASKTVARRKGKIYIVGHNATIDNAIRTAGMHKILHFADNLEDALEQDK